MNRSLVAVVMAGVTWAGSASAQSIYVGGAVAAEVVRTSSTKSGGTTYDAGNGEAIAGAMRVGTFVTDKVGVELEYFRPGEIESDLGGPIYLADSVSSYSWSDGGVTSFSFGSIPPSLPTSPSLISQTSHVRTSTTSALLTFRQPLGGRVDLVYLGGVGFSRVVREIEYDFPGGILPLARLIQRPSSTRMTQYSAGPVVGAEVRARMTEHAQIVAGLRVHTLGQSSVDGWMIRPSVGLAWRF